MMKITSLFSQSSALRPFGGTSLHAKLSASHRRNKKSILIRRNATQFYNKQHNLCQILFNERKAMIFHPGEPGFIKEREQV
jgi:hypothetical protein